MVVGRISTLVEVMYVVVAEAAFAIHLQRRRLVVDPISENAGGDRFEKAAIVLVALSVALVALTVTEMVDVVVVVQATLVVLGTTVEVKVEFR